MLLSVSSILFIITSYSRATAIPAANPLELASLKSSGLTENLVYTRPDVYPFSPRIIPRDLSRRQGSSGCDGVTGESITTGLAQACANVFNQDGNSWFPVTGDNTVENVMCWDGAGPIVSAYNVGPNPSTETIGSNIADSINWILNECQINGRVAGHAVANGDGEMQLIISQY